MRRFFCALGTGTLALLLAGCGGDGRRAVRGSVTYEGQPVDSGGIAFIPQGGDGVKAGGEIKDGKYTIDADRGPTPGKYRVEITWDKPTGRKVKDVADTGAVIDERKQALPAQFNTNSTLTTEVKSRSNTLDFDLKSK